MTATTCPEQASILRHRCLGFESVYRVIGSRDGLTEVEVVDVPGLNPGHRLWLAAIAPPAAPALAG